MNIGVGVIGAGNWGRNLVRIFAQLGVLKGVAEAAPLTREALKSQFPGVPLYSEPNRLLDQEINAVVIATPANLHYVLARQALLAGKDVLVEKPLALSRQEAAELVEIAAKKERILMVGHLLLYQTVVRKIKNCLASGIIGTPLIYSQERLKLGTVRTLENVLWSFGVHDLAVLFYLLDEHPQKCTVIGQCALSRQRKIEDDVYLHLHYAQEVTAHLHVSWLWPEPRRRLTIVGSEAMLVYDEIRRQLVLHKKCVEQDLVVKDEGCEVIFEERAEPLLNECQHFLECVSTRVQPLSDGYSALPVIALLEEAGQKLLEM